MAAMPSRSCTTIDDTSVRVQKDRKRMLTLQPMPTAREMTKSVRYHHIGTSLYFSISK